MTVQGKVSLCLSRPTETSLNTEHPVSVGRPGPVSTENGENRAYRATGVIDGTSRFGKRAVWAVRGEVRKAGLSVSATSVHSRHGGRVRCKLHSRDMRGTYYESSELLPRSPISPPGAGSDVRRSDSFVPYSPASGCTPMTAELQLQRTRRQELGAVGKPGSLAGTRV